MDNTIKVKKSFSLLELLIIISVVAIVVTHSIQKNNLSKIKIAKNQILLHLKYTRYIAMLDNKYDKEDALWHKKRWSLKFLNCQSAIGGIYYVVYSDLDNNGAIKKTEALKDPLTNNYIYSYQCTKDNLYDKSKFVLLSQEYEIQSVDISCNETSTIGQISFGYDGKVYARNGTHEDDYEIKKPCTIKLFDKHNQSETITIYPNSGYIVD
ncbi:MAG: type II secretion system protein [Epsilonproteobacteria bacterium]|nr:type II secretion system protein [Campylobacterota bacterium]